MSGRRGATVSAAAGLNDRDSASSTQATRPNGGCGRQFGSVQDFDMGAPGEISR
jgi:hypothetical protein